MPLVMALSQFGPFLAFSAKATIVPYGSRKHSGTSRSCASALEMLGVVDWLTAYVKGYPTPATERWRRILHCGTGRCWITLHRSCHTRRYS
jgi:hypothetical protein